MTEPLPELVDRQRLQAEPTTVYIARKGRRVLYVGITGRNLRRMHAHARSSEWWRQASRIELRHLPTRREAEALERKLIGEWSPPFNVAHNKTTTIVVDANLLDLEALMQFGFPRGAARGILRLLPAVTVGQKTYVKRSALDAYIVANTHPPGSVR